jgi:signal transduction histidine kinase/DNA-binding response OmpR family regulator
VRKFLVITSIIVLILLGLGSWYIFELVQQRTDESLEMLLKRSVYQTSRLTDYLDSFPVDAEHFIKRNDIENMLSGQEMSPDTYWDTKSFYRKYEAVLDTIRIYNKDTCRIISGNQVSTFDMSVPQHCLHELSRINDRFLDGSAIVYQFPIINQDNMVVANVLFKLNLPRLIKIEMEAQGLEKSDWILALKDSKVFASYSKSHFVNNSLQVDLISSRKNVTHAQYIVLNSKAVIKVGKNSIPVMYAYNPMTLLNAEYGLVIATERAAVLSVVTRITVIISLIFLCIIIATVLGFYHMLKAMRKEEIDTARITSAVDNASDLVLITHANYQTIYSNQSFNSKTLQSLSANKLERLISDPERIDEMKLAVSQNETWASEVDVMTIGNIKMPCLVRASVIKDHHNTQIGILFIATDITQRKRSEKIKNEFISTVSHELRTPLTSIRGSLGLIKGGVAGDIPPQMNKLLDIAHSNSERLIRLINDILDIEKIEAGGMEFHLEKAELLPEVTRVIGLLTGYASQFNVKIEMTKSISGIDVMIDKDRFEQVLNNLLSNASKFSAAGSIVEVEMARMDDLIRINVRDRGIGIPEEFREIMFKKFAQVDSSDTRSKGGTGLGLSICKAIMEKLGGRIDYTSVVNQGSTFFVDLPIYRVPGSVSEHYMDDDKPHILIVEDDIDIASLINIVFTNAGYHTDIAYSAEDAKEKLKTKTYRLISLDLLLPQQQGISFIRELRDNEATATIPIVVVSAVADKQKSELHGGFGIVDWISKPIDMDRLRSAVRKSICCTTTDCKTLLYIEDDKDNLLIVQELLKDRAVVLSATSVAEAKQVVSNEQPDLIIMDLHLPDGNGMDIIAYLHQIGKSSIPVVLLSATEIPTEASKEVALSLVKSKTSNEDLISLINKLLSGT